MLYNLTNHFESKSEGHQKKVVFAKLNEGDQNTGEMPQFAAG